MKNIITIALSLLISLSTIKAQNVRFPPAGVIEFEKSTNMYAIMKKAADKSSENYMREAYDNYKKNNPQFKVLQSTLTFSNDKTLFTPIAPAENPRGFFNDPMSEQNSTVYNDLANGLLTAQKKVYEETFLLKDSIRRINWKLTSEVRTIAGYECRRANAVILDSIYVVAFYTDKIPVSGGPESFNGLPGMILGVALPHENITWFAKTVTDKSIPVTELKVPAKGKPMDYKTLKTTINSALKDWGDYAQAAIKAFML
ncbi:MAG: GLPGLI family protein [Pedobacter sp.]|nr:MAG: GLPGLI family protein [Pedobacter sp.]